MASRTLGCHGRCAADIDKSSTTTAEVKMMMLNMSKGKEASSAILGFEGVAKASRMTSWMTDEFTVRIS